MNELRIQPQIGIKPSSVDLNGILSVAVEKLYNDQHDENIYYYFHEFYNSINNYINENNSFESYDEFIKNCRQHPIHNILQQAAYNRRQFNKPRGYSGDAVTIDYIYRLKGSELEDSYLGREIHNACMDTSACASVRWRARHLADKIELASQDQKPNILSLASGHLRELLYISDFENKIGNFYAVDQDKESNEEARRSLPYHNLFITENSVLDVILGKYSTAEPLHFIYSCGLFDYLNDKVASKLILRCMQMLAPGGKLLIANFVPGIVEQAYMEAFMDWYLIYRDEAQMESLINKETKPLVEDIKMYRDPMGNVVYMEVVRK